METTVRLRLEFDNILSELQKAEDLKLCWILLKPEHKTISDLASYLLRVFDLQNACPGGLLLSVILSLCFSDFSDVNWSKWFLGL
uniref:Uncharacterized protein n=1 Tax=Rhizophora mucronata TaxID=61149 RepID=A0A2P2KS47_RHIMU